MTAKQREVRRLYAKGNTVSDIAQITGRSKSAVYSMLKTIKIISGAPVVRKSVPCKNSHSCFTCPLKDCVVTESVIVRTNLLPVDMEGGGQH